MLEQLHTCMCSDECRSAKTQTHTQAQSIHTAKIPADKDEGSSRQQPSDFTTVSAAKVFNTDTVYGV